MKSVSEQFQALRDRQQCALIPFVTAGDPDLATTAEALKTIDRCGADFLELGVPYSDPLADGPVIQAAATRALQKGTTLDQVLELVKTVSPELQAPIILFTYYNPILNRGIEAFFKDIAAAGAKGLVVPDLPLEEVSAVTQAAAQYGIEVILLVAPTSPQARIRAIAKQAQGFIYLSASPGSPGCDRKFKVASKNCCKNCTQLQINPSPWGLAFHSLPKPPNCEPGALMAWSWAALL